ncbi:iron-sulfur cluster assembly scaffold protein [Bartonella sp. HY406]|uniref:iron-sulfur cluster assembly scaffold protein n=1 Tax=Bartonella sp. HY406 TaxID=2979331 RepID=UPI0021C97A99|nr:iron-sulfur cluster assembly scaffold protein [Bartonella sp. HY406]UXN04484.1 iron-sulfur cluster assembly scaffold protein [Bartonella sp. HY406]
MIDDIYNSKILSAAAHISLTGRLSDADASSRQHSKICGSIITVDIKITNGIVTEFAQEVRACALGQASASLLANHVIGASTRELMELKDVMYAMLKEDGQPPIGKFEELGCLQPVKDFKARHASTLLVFDAVVDCIQQIEITA